MSDSIQVTINGRSMAVNQDKSVLQALNEHDLDLPSVCYHPSLGAIETCDTCMVEVNGEIVRGCSTKLSNGDSINTTASHVKEAQNIAMDRILYNHELYCTVCDYNNGTCEVHNTVKQMKMNHQAFLLNKTRSC